MDKFGRGSAEACLRQKSSSSIYHGETAIAFSADGVVIERLPWRSATASKAVLRQWGRLSRIKTFSNHESAFWGRL